MPQRPMRYSSNLSLPARRQSGKREWALISPTGKLITKQLEYIDVFITNVKNDKYIGRLNYFSIDKNGVKGWSILVMKISVE